MTQVSSDRKPIVLLVEDAPDQRAGTAEILEEEFDVRQAASAEDGLKLANELGFRLDIAVVDRMMPSPGMQGDNLALILAERGCRVIILSAKKGSDHRKALLGPAIAYLEKPMDPDELVRHLRIAARLRFADEVAERMAALAVAMQHTTGTFGNGFTASHYIVIDEIPPSQRPFVETLCLAARDLKSALHQLDIYCRLRLERFNPAMEYVRVADHLTMRRRQVSSILTSRQITLTEDLCDRPFIADSTLVDLILNAMIRHALGAARRNTEILVTFTNELVMTVQYEGQGFEPDELQRLFEPGPPDPYRHGERDFGLDWVNAAMAARILGAHLTADSDGRESGATFSAAFPDRSVASDLLANARVGIYYDSSNAMEPGKGLPETGWRAETSTGTNPH